MKDIMQKLAELEATAPKVTKKKMLNEDSTTPPMNVSNKPASFKDVFENMAMQKQPIPVVGKQGDTQETGAGFLHVTDNSPAAQALSNAFSDLASQGKAQIVMPTAGQQSGQQTQQTKPTGQAGQQQQTGLGGTFGHSLYVNLTGTLNTITTQQYGASETVINLKSTGSNGTFNIKTGH